MCSEYTNMIDKSLVQFCEEDEMEAFDFLTNPSSFRSFGEGLTTILKKTDYAGDLNNNEEKSKYLLHKLQEIHSTTGIKTIRSWFDGSRRPKILNASREKIYEICFALNLSITDVEWFFHHVYFDRCFNFHNRTEAVYAFCFVNNLPYGKAKEIIHTIENQEAKPVEQNDVGINYTKFVKQQILSFKSEEELVSFLVSQNGNFVTWNQSAYRQISQYYNVIWGSAESKSVVDDLKREVKRKLDGHDISSKNRIDTKGLESCGLLFKEIVWNAKNEQSGDTVCDCLAEMLCGTVFSNVFFLRQMCINPKISLKNTKVPDVISNNFPSEKVLSEVLDDIKIGKSVSYDSIRKVLVILHFYIFWCNVKIENPDMMEYDLDELSGIYRDEANYCLCEAGYEDLYAGNPFDWMFLYAAQQPEPLDSFRELVGIIMERDV